MLTRKQLFAALTRCKQVSYSLIQHAHKQLFDMLKTFQRKAIENFEIIIVDDGSNETTTNIACSFLSDPRVRLVKMKQHVFAQ